MAKSAFNYQDPEEARDPTTIAQIYEWARKIPVGRVLSYGALGALCSPPISGYICGRIMNRAMADVPWWRVVGKEGNMPISKRNPHLGVEQRERLEEEDVDFEDNCVIMERFTWTPDDDTPQDAALFE